MTADRATDSRTDRETTGLVFNVQKYALHDGPGIRTLVFLKGCSLRCRWCCNPESWAGRIELAYNPDRCLTLSRCSRCVTACPSAAISAGDDDRIRIDRSLCNTCLRCVDACPADALAAYGAERSVAEILDTVEQDSVFYARSGGGMTLSGGEPLFQPAFALALLREAGRRRIRTAMETCGHAAYRHLKAACEQIRTLLFDIKCMDPVKHIRFTGMDNGRIRDNFVRICRDFPNLAIRVRTPVVPGFNDTPGDISDILTWLDENGSANVTYDLLPYHRLGTMKYRAIGRTCAMDEQMLSAEAFARLRSMVDASRSLVDSAAAPFAPVQPAEPPEVSEKSETDRVVATQEDPGPEA